MTDWILSFYASHIYNQELKNKLLIEISHHELYTAVGSWSGYLPVASWRAEAISLPSKSCNRIFNCNLHADCGSMSFPLATTNSVDVSNLVF